MLGINWMTLIEQTIIYATPLIFAALGGVYSERSGIVALGLEGFMILSAFAGAHFANVSGNLWIGLLAGGLAGMLTSVIHAVAAIRYKAEQVVTGVAMNLLALGLAQFLVVEIYGGGNTENIPFFGRLSLFGLSVYPTSIIAFLLVAATWFLFYQTPFGLRLRAVGEHPRAADTAGISVGGMRTAAVLTSGLLAGLGGTTVTLTQSPTFSHSTIVGQGFIALAAVIFGKWHPVGAMLAALFFGFTVSTNAVFQATEIIKVIPSDFFQMLPYVLTLLALAGFVGRANAPAAIGKPYEKGSR